ncbi:NAD(P) transhydrogenase subunit alpha [Desulfococcus sp.]|uniref:NAD(P) transhydrogenase subunit alpha n=1 Tax=Desulfococcus sp. TaxID=2025834 RepID=UPI0035949449
MKIGFVSERDTGEPRIAVVPPVVERYRKAGIEVVVERGIGCHLGMSDDAFTAAGAETADRRTVLSAPVLARLRAPEDEEVPAIPAGTLHISFLDPFTEAGRIERMAARGLAAASMQMIPRSTYAQKMDALSSQANLGGYVAVILGAARSGRIMPMMTTPAGTIKPMTVLVVGVGVAGLQAIATARRLGARVSAFDTRPVVEEQVKSLGAKFVKIDIGETGQTQDGYARELTPEQLRMQRDGMAKICAQSDLIITTAQVFGRPAPRILTAEMLAAMRPGTIVVDMAVESGGNVEGSRKDEEVDEKGVIILGHTNLPGRVPVDASTMYAMNVFHLVQEFLDEKTRELRLDAGNKITEACLLTRSGAVLKKLSS